MIEAIVDRVRSVQTIATRATLAPLLVRAGILVSTALALVLAYPVEVLAGRGLGLLLIVAALPAVAPRRVWPTVATLVAVGGWLLSTSWYDEPIALWRLLALATLLYLSHSLCALAAQLAYDAVVAPELVARWVARSLAVALAAAVLAVLLMALADRAGGGSILAAVLGGLAVAVAVAALLSWLLRRR